MASTRMAFGSILGTVTATATAASDLIETAGLGVGMLNKFVREASTDQTERAVAHRATFRETVLREASMEIAVGNAEALEFCKQSEQNETLYMDAQSKLKAAFAAFDQPTK